MKENALSSTVDTLDTMWKALDKVRSTSKTVTVNRDGLAALLLDHSRMAQTLFAHKPIRRLD